jgi:hypothetical protein
MIRAIAKIKKNESQPPSPKVEILKRRKRKDKMKYPGASSWVSSFYKVWIVCGIHTNQQPRPKETRYVVLIRYLYSGFNILIKRPKAPPRTGERALGIKPLNTNKEGSGLPSLFRLLG